MLRVVFVTSNFVPFEPAVDPIVLPPPRTQSYPVSSAKTKSTKAATLVLSSPRVTISNLLIVIPWDSK